MTVIDQLRHAATLDERVTELEAAVVHARDVLTGDLDGQELFDRLQACTDELAAYLVELDDEPSGSKNPPADEATKPEPKPARKRAAKSTTKKAARRSVSPAPAAGQVDTKWCPDCERRLPAAEFGRHARTKDGLQPRCRTCAGRRSKAGRDAARLTKAPQNVAPVDSHGDATVTPITAAADDLVAVCPVHSVVARQPRNEVTVPDDAWLFTARSNHRLNDRCERELALQGRAA